MWPFNLLKNKKDGKNLSALSRTELETELKKTTEQLSEGKNSLEKNIEQRTNEISAERNKLAVILSGIVDCVIALDLNRNVVTFNKAAEKMLGISKSNALGKPISLL